MKPALNAVPNRQHKEILIRGGTITTSLRQCSLGEIVQAVNQALRNDKAVAARRLRSRDTVITFKTSEEDL